MQNVKLQDIKSVLDSLQPKDLINLSNLTAAIALLQQLLSMQAKGTIQSSTASATQSILAKYQGTTASAFNSLTPSQQATLGGYAPFVGANIPTTINFTPSGVGFGNNGTGRQVPTSVNIYANTIANPDELTNLIQDSIIKLNRRGDQLTQAGAL
jgi:hypothetical protein